MGYGSLEWNLCRQAEDTCDADFLPQDVSKPGWAEVLRYIGEARDVTLR